MLLPPDWLLNDTSTSVVVVHDNVNENMELDTELTTNEESENTEVTADTNETVENEVSEVTLETEILETEDFEAKYNDALTEIEQLKAQITELTPYKLAVERLKEKRLKTTFLLNMTHV